MKTPELFFVYNADSGWGNALWDSLHKWIRPETYSCSLCRLTHGAFGSKKAWREFIGEIGMPARFLHKDEWVTLRGSGGGDPQNLPAVYLKRQETFELLVGPELLNAFQDIEELIRVLQAKIGT